MKVFHGSDTFIEKVDLSKCKLGRDFGQGFYVTKIYAQAENMAARVAKWNNKTPIITEFDFNEIAYADNDLKLLQFDFYNEAWLDFVILNRRNNLPEQAHKYDIVEGPVANDAVTIRIADYLQNKVSKATFLEELKFKKPTHQICFCTLQSLLTLERIKNRAENDIFHTDDLIIQQLIIDFDMSEIRASDLYFDSATYSRLIDEFTGLHKRPWINIYNLLLKELNFKR
jgi:hypothetical protein